MFSSPLLLALDVAFLTRKVAGASRIVLAAFVLNPERRTAGAWPNAREGLQ